MHDEREHGWNNGMSSAGVGPMALATKATIDTAATLFISLWYIWMIEDWKEPGMRDILQSFKNPMQDPSPLEIVKSGTSIRQFRTVQAC